MNAQSHMRLRAATIGGLLIAAGLVSARSEDRRTAVVEVGSAELPLLGRPKAEFRAQRAELMKRVKEAASKQFDMGAAMRKARGGGGGSGSTVVVLIGAGEGGDDAKFRQTNDFAYLSGIDAPFASMILLPNENKETLYLPPRDAVEEGWNGPRLGPGPEAEKRSGFIKVESSANFLSDLFKAIGDPRKRSHGAPAATVYLLSPEGGSGGGESAKFARFLKEGAPNARLRDVAPIIAELRKVKTDGEVALLRKAIAATGDAQDAVIRGIAPGIPEYRLEGAILGAFVSAGAERPGFPSIVGSGLNSTILHYNENRRVMADGDLVVVDIGAEYSYYTADITRTYPVSGKFSPRQREIYRLVLDAQAKAAAAVKPGETKMSDLNQLVRDLFRNSPLRAKDDKGVERTLDVFFRHGLGHYLGMDVHDVGDYSKPFGPGEVITIEPGIYIESEGFGVRIEDDYLVTKTGLEKLSRDIPSEPDEIEKRIQEARDSRSRSAKVKVKAASP